LFYYQRRRGEPKEVITGGASSQRRENSGTAKYARWIPSSGKNINESYSGVHYPQTRAVAKKEEIPHRNAYMKKFLRKTAESNLVPRQ